MLQGLRLLVERRPKSFFLGGVEGQAPRLSSVVISISAKSPMHSSKLVWELEVGFSSLRGSDGVKSRKMFGGATKSGNRTPTFE